MTTPHDDELTCRSIRSIERANAWEQMISRMSTAESCPLPRRY